MGSREQWVKPCLWRPDVSVLWGLKKGDRPEQAIIDIQAPMQALRLEGVEDACAALSPVHPRAAPPPASPFPDIPGGLTAMPRTVETVVYSIEELSETPKESARVWFRETSLDHEWYDAVFEDFETICRILGVTLRTSPVRLYGGGTRQNPHLFFRAVSSQGDGASFEGSLEYAPGGARAIRARAPKDEELHRIADELQAVQRRNFYQLTGTIRTRGNYCHEYSMAIDVERDSLTWQPMTDGAEDTVIEAMRNLARWLYRQLEREYEYLTSDDAVDEAIAINSWSFTAKGIRFG